MVKMIDEDKGESNSWTVWVGGSELIVNTYHKGEKDTG
jgi:hypothetical protein